MRKNKHYQIYTQTERLGMISINQSGSVSATGSKKLQSLVTTAKTDGVKALAAINQESAHITVRRRVAPSDQHFGLALIQWLRQRGYILVQHRPDLDVRLKKMLKTIPDDSAAKQQVLKLLPSMTTLEKTHIIAALAESTSEKQVK
jgi:hypothetical protein